jgi:adenine C2-methylase RlmN of 23S rRNA A2503 and tRNA A37
MWLYTTSVSSGCVLHALKQHCRFCRTGTLLSFSGFLTAYDIAKQNIFMVLSDIYCNDHHNLKNNAREFAYMGQGEPGYSYSQVRRAIKLTDIAMKSIGQKVYRHIIATSGITEMIEAYKCDIKYGFFESRITLHYSLHATESRAIIMPIENTYSYKSVLEAMNNVADLTGEKPCLGILLFNQFKQKGANWSYTNDYNTIKKILEEIDSSKYRLSFCEYNDINDISFSELYEEEEGKKILELAKAMGFEAKLFSSFGKEEVTACGLLAGQVPSNTVSKKWLDLEIETEKLLKLATQELNSKI